MKALSGYLKKQYESRNVAFFLMILLVAAFAVYYSFRLFALTPWYDELYTYYYFISNGPIYSAIHWPVPNNHIGYSVLSGFFRIFGNGYIALRIVSYFAALANLVLVYRIGRYHFCGEFAFAAVLFYTAMYQVNVLAVQGRGYTLACTCMLTASLMLFRIVKDQKEQMRYYVIWSVCLAYGLYIVSSSLFWVIPLCLIGGFCLLSQKRIKELVRLILYSVYAAVAVAFLYGVVWLAIGSNLLTKDETSGLFGQGHVSIILHHPLKSALTGVEYMLASPYIQSVPREGYLTKLGGWLKSMANLLYGGFAVPLLVLLLIGLVYCAIRIFLDLIGKRALSIRYAWCFGVLLGVPILLVLQSKLPYYRVFSYIGSTASVLLLLLFQDLLDYVKGDPQEASYETRKRTIALVVLLFSLFSLNYLVRAENNAQYGDREAAAEDAIAQIPVADILGGNICVTDVDQQYLLKLNYGISCENTDPGTVSYFLVYRPVLEEAYDPSANWEQLTDTEVLKSLLNETGSSIIYENSYYEVIKH